MALYKVQVRFHKSLNWNETEMMSVCTHLCGSKPKNNKGTSPLVVSLEPFGGVDLT